MARVSFTSPMTGGTVQVPESEASKYLAAGWVLVKEGNKAGAARVVENTEKEAQKAAKVAAREQRSPQEKAAETRRKNAAKTAAPKEDSAPVKADVASLKASLPNPDPDAPGDLKKS